MPDPLEFMLRTPLYESYSVPSVEAWHDLIYLSGRHDEYCVYCGKVTLFERTSGGLRNQTGAQEILNQRVADGVRQIEIACLQASHAYRSYFLVTDQSAQKIGQFPSVADLHASDRLKYQRILGRSRMGELVRADGLAAHGIGIGAFVYLRRIFESLVDEEYAIARKKDGWDEDAFQRARMDEKILILRDQLPAFLVDNRPMYGILSKGVHELSEDECKAYFSAVRTGIEIILDERLEARAREQRISGAKRMLNAAAEAIKKGTASALGDEATDEAEH